MPDLSDTSVPPWVVEQPQTSLDVSGVRYVLVGVGRDAESIIERWRRDLADRQVAFCSHADEDSARRALEDELCHARVGVRVRLTGPVGTCLTLRGVALDAGLNDDEISVMPAGHGTIEVYCTHCRGASRAFAAVGDTIACTNCQRSLLIYYHVSRRSGQFMGFMVNAEATSP